MSTLTSADMHLKRSSTRVQAPPGGASSLSFGPGGFGATETSDNNDSVDAYSASYIHQEKTRQPPQSAGMHNSRRIPSPSAAVYDNDTLSIASFGHDTAKSSTIGGHTPHPSFHARSHVDYTLTAGKNVAERSANYHSQPPLTSSIRDQSWDKKRRQWLARSRSGIDEPISNNIHSDDITSDQTSIGYTFRSANHPSNISGSSEQPLSPLSNLICQHDQKSELRSNQRTNHHDISRSTHPSLLPYGSDMVQPDKYLSQEQQGFANHYTVRSNSRAINDVDSSSIHRKTAHETSKNLPSARSNTSSSASNASFGSRASSRQPPGGYTSWSPFT